MDALESAPGHAHEFQGATTDVQEVPITEDSAVDDPKKAAVCLLVAGEYADLEPGASVCPLDEFRRIGRAAEGFGADDRNRRGLVGTGHLSHDRERPQATRHRRFGEDTGIHAFAHTGVEPLFVDDFEGG